MRISLTILAGAATLALAACSDAGSPESMGEDGAVSTPSDAATSAAPDTPVSNSPSPGASAPPEPMPAPDSTSADDECGAAKVSAYVAQEATPAVRTRLAADVGHDRIRWVGPDTVVTMDFRPDRLNVELDSAGVITGGKCS